MINTHWAIIYFLAMTGFEYSFTSTEFANGYGKEVGDFCGWDVSDDNADAFNFKPSNLVKIVKPISECAQLKSFNKPTPSPNDSHTNKRKRSNLRKPNQLDPISKRKRKKRKNSPLKHRKHKHDKSSTRHKRKLAKIPLTQIIAPGTHSHRSDRSRNHSNNSNHSNHSNHRQDHREGYSKKPKLEKLDLPSPHAHGSCGGGANNSTPKRTQFHYQDGRYKLMNHEHQVHHHQNHHNNHHQNHQDTTNIPKENYSVEVILQNRQNKSIREFLSRRKQGKLKHIGAIPFSRKSSVHTGNCTPRELVPIVTKIEENINSKNRRENQRHSKHHGHHRKGEDGNGRARNAYSEPSRRSKHSHPHRSKHVHAKMGALSHHLQRQESVEMHKEINKIMGQRRFYLDHLKAIFDSLDSYIGKLDSVHIARSGQQVETILCRFDKNIVYHLRDLRMVTWNLVFFLKAIQSRSKSNLSKFSKTKNHHNLDNIELTYASYHDVISALLQDGDFVGKFVNVMAYLRLPNTMCNPFLLPKAVLDPLNRCASSKKLSLAIDNLKAVDLKHDLNRSYKLNEMDKHRYLSAHQWLLQLYQSSIFQENKDSMSFDKKHHAVKRKKHGKTKFPKLGIN